MNPLIGDFWMCVSFKGTSAFDFHQRSVPDHPGWAGKTIAQLRDQEQVVVLAIWRNKKFDYTPATGEKIRATDELIVFSLKPTTDHDPFKVET